LPSRGTSSRLVAGAGSYTREPISFSPVGEPPSGSATPFSRICALRKTYSYSLSGSLASSFLGVIEERQSEIPLMARGWENKNNTDKQGIPWHPIIVLALFSPDNQQATRNVQPCSFSNSSILTHQPPFFLSFIPHLRTFLSPKSDSGPVLLPEILK
jgi:hypothetical protein